MSPRYRPLVKRIKPNVIEVNRWADDAVSKLQGCLESTDWSVFVDANPELSDLVDVVSSYIQFCRENSIPTKKVKVSPNNKPWITKEVKSVINRKKQLYGRGEKDKLNAVQKEIARVIKVEKAKYRDTLEKKLAKNYIKQVWEGMRLMSGYSNNCKKHSDLPCTSAE
ncbi:hypothetical protein HOLleu_39377 [Holothuria leucospilota]|uniref:Uncharacterized protein n=1 Tax=Holothuria leucospilota TaxID=206669 RepID=A0A9Q1BCX3_HOLLE|nr:hypothetical protein HOLleu_39377 [Holothuria leucospilota]